MRESPTQRNIWIACAALAGVILFRVNTGRAWVGAGPGRRQSDGSVVVPGGRPIALGFGLINGDPAVGVGDLIGWSSVVVTPDMVGCRIAVFTSIEAKRSDGKGRVSEDQRRWRDVVLKAGGIAGVASDEEQAKAIIEGWRPMRFQSEGSTPA
jgi:hypothetical protein